MEQPALPLEQAWQLRSMAEAEAVALRGAPPAPGSAPDRAAHLTASLTDKRRFNFNRRRDETRELLKWQQSKPNYNGELPSPFEDISVYKYPPGPVKVPHWPGSTAQHGGGRMSG